MAYLSKNLATKAKSIKRLHKRNKTISQGHKTSETNELTILLQKSYKSRKCTLTDISKSINQLTK